MKLQFFFLTMFLATVFTSCKSDESSEEDTDTGAHISNVRFTPRYFNSTSDLLVEWDSTNPLDETRITITGTDFRSGSVTHSNSLSAELPANNYNFYLQNSKGINFGPFAYTYLPMVYELNNEYDIYDETNTIKWRFSDYGSLSATKFQIEYGLQGFEIGNGTRKNIFNTSDMINYERGELLITDNINQGGTYDFYVRSIYNSLGESEWSGPYEIEFANNYLNCETPTIESLNYNGGEVSISWNKSGIAYQFSFFASSTTNPADGNIKDLITLGNSATYGVAWSYGHLAIRSKCLDGSYTPWSVAYYYD